MIKVDRRDIFKLCISHIKKVVPPTDLYRISREEMNLFSLGYEEGFLEALRIFQEEQNETEKTA